MPDLKRQEIVAKITEVAERVGGSEGIEIVDVQLLGAGKARLLRLFIDKPGGVTHTDCELISKHVGTILDMEDIIPGDSYTLEVSSPGVERKLSRVSDFERFSGQKAKVVLREPVDNQKHWEGTLAGISDGIIALEAAAGRTIHFAITQVEKANLKFEW